MLHGVTPMFQDLESQVLNSELSRLGGMESQKSSISKLGMPSLEQKRCKISDRWTRSFTCVHVLEDQVMKDIILGIDLMLNLFTPKSFKTWEAKSWIVHCQDLGAWKCKNVAFQYLACQVLNKKGVRFQTTEQEGTLVFMSWKTKSWKTSLLA